jgi:Ca2+-binding RTX toxin-like protein
VYDALGPAGKLVTGDARFVKGAGLSQGQDATDRLVYDTASGGLYYDADGSGTSASVLVATLQGAPSLLPTDIIVV